MGDTVGRHSRATLCNGQCHPITSQNGPGRAARVGISLSIVMGGATLSGQQRRCRVASWKKCDGGCGTMLLVNAGADKPHLCDACEAKRAPAEVEPARVPTFVVRRQVLRLTAKGRREVRAYRDEIAARVAAE